MANNGYDYNFELVWENQITKILIVNWNSVIYIIFKAISDIRTALINISKPRE